MGDFIGQLRARQAQINAEIGQHLSAIAALSNELSDIAVAGRVFAGIASTKTNTPGGESGTAREAPGDKRTEQSEMRGLEEGLEAAPRTQSQAKVSTGNDGGNAPLHSAPVSGEASRLSDGSGSVDHAADTSGTMSDVSAAMTSLLGDADAASDSHATGKPGAASSEAAPAPTIASRLRTLNAEHPEFTVDQAADALGIPREKARSNSNVNRIRWARAATVAPASKQRAPESQGLQERVRDTHYRHRDWSDDQIAAHVGCGSSYVRTVAQRLGLTLASRRAPQKAVEPAPAPDEPSPTPKPERPPAVKSGPAIDAPRIPRPLSGSKFHLVNDKGEYLNRFCAGFTTDKRTAWIGTEQQLAACRRNFDIARDLTERPVGKELPPVPVNREVA